MLIEAPNGPVALEALPAELDGELLAVLSHGVFLST